MQASHRWCDALPRNLSTVASSRSSLIPPPNSGLAVTIRYKFLYRARSGRRVGVNRACPPALSVWTVQLFSELFKLHAPRTRLPARLTVRTNAVTHFSCSRTLLRTLPLFSGLADAQVDALLPHVQHRSYPSRFRILHAGENTDGLYLLLSGRVAVLHEDPLGHQFIARTIGAGDFFGELGLLESEPCAASVQSQEPCEVLFLARGRVLEFLGQSPDAALGMLRTVVKRLHDAHGKMHGLALTTVYDRVASVLLECSRVIDGERRVEVGAERIAAMVGASREMVSRVIGDMIRRHVVRRERRKLIVVDDSGLSRPVSENSHACAARRELSSGGVQPSVA